jgi:hypothetical protein
MPPIEPWVIVFFESTVDLDGAKSGPAIVCLTGFRKPVRSAVNDHDYRAAHSARDEFQRARWVVR